MARDDLVGDGSRHVRQAELGQLPRQLGVEDDLEQEVPQLLAQGAPGAALAQAVHLVQDLVGLLHEVRAEGADVLRAVPGAAPLGAQCAHDLLQPLHGVSGASHVLPDPGPGS
jgi:hypothetical protein